MRIGFVIYGSLDTLSGGYLYDGIVVRGLRQLGHTVEVVSLPSGGYLRQLANGLSPSLSRRLLSGNYDILIQDELCHPLLFLLNRRLCRQDGRPLLLALVHHILSDEPRHHWHNALLAVAERGFLKTVDGFIYNSRTTRSKVRSLVAHNLPEVVAYPAGDRFGTPLSADAIDKRTRRSGPLELLFLGNIIPRKGLLPLLRALAGIDRTLWRLSVVGGLGFDTAHTAEVRQLTAELGLSNAVRFMGPLQERELVDALSSSHIFCMPYAYEGFGIAILEAMAFGLPAIGCQDGAAGETIRHGTNGFLLAPADLSGLEPLLTRLYRDREELLRLSLAACATNAHSPGWQDGVAAIEGFLMKLKGQQGNSRGTRSSRGPGTSSPRDTDRSG